VANELWDTLLRFHREVAAPEIIGPLHEEIVAVTRENQRNFDGIWVRLERLESEYQGLNATMKRVEQKIDSHHASS
jgi:hypothetical protein